MSKESPYHQQLLVVGGFLGGISFTGLVLVLSLPTSFQVAFWKLPAYVYYETLVGVLAATSAFFAFGSLALSPVAAGSSSSSSERERYGRWCFSIGFLLLLIDLPLLLAPLAPVAAGVILIVELFLFYWLMTARQK